MRTIDGYNWFITFIDDYSRYGYIYPIKILESLDNFKLFEVEVKNQHDLKIKIVRPNREREYYECHTLYVQVPVPFQSSSKIVP